MRVLDDWLLTAERVAVHLPSRTAVVADLHLGYAEARRRDGDAVPDDRPDESLSALGRVLHRHSASRLVIAGDLLEDGRCTAALAHFLAWLERERVELAAVVPGNHDRLLEAPAGGRLPLFPEGFSLGGWRVIHGDGPIPDGPIIEGHEHPCLRWAPRNRTIRPRVFGGRIAPGAVETPCYLAAPGRLVLPTYSTEAAGVNVLTGQRWGCFRCYAVAGEGIVDLGEVSRIKKL